MSDALLSPKNEIWLSLLSIWKTLLLAEKNRIRFDRPAEKWIADSLQSAPVHEAPFSFEVVLVSHSVALPHRDPFDRQLIATARAYGLTLVTADENLMTDCGVPVLANL